MRLEAASSSDMDATGDRDAFFHLAKRARRLEKWYLDRTKEAELQNQATTAASQGMPTGNTDEGMAFSTIVPGQPGDAGQEFQMFGSFPVIWSPDATMEFGSDMGLGQPLFRGFSTFTDDSQ